MSGITPKASKSRQFRLNSIKVPQELNPRNTRLVVKSPKEDLVELMWLTDHTIKKVLVMSGGLEEARDRLFDYLNSLERHYFNVHSEQDFKDLHMLEKNNAKECIRVLKNVIRTENEHLTGFSALGVLYDIAKGRTSAINNVTEGFFAEFIYLFKGINGKSDILFGDELQASADENNRLASVNRSSQLDHYARKMNTYFTRYHTGLEPEIRARRDALKAEIMAHFGADQADWQDFGWQMKHIITDHRTLSALVKLEKDELEALKYAEDNHIHVQITPYYFSLFNKAGRSGDDRAVRAQVLPSMGYCKTVVKNRQSDVDMDFMGEKWTSPVEGITRRYPQILILKPYDSCPQICVYCQRNWEIKGIDHAGVKKDSLRNAIQWIKDNESISEVLITGGDPFTLNDRYIDALLGRVSEIDHVERIRIGTRTPVTVPFRITPELADILKQYHQPGIREVCIVTHFEHPMEMTPESLEAVQRIRQAGMSVYNQQVFTYYNSRRYETAKLRKVLKICGIDPYYTFNTKGKDETVDFRVPIARMEQERKEEARLQPGVVRTDEPVFNVPKLGKSHLRAWQDHEVIMIMPGGQRSYRFYPWESKLAICDTYIYTDVSIFDYLRRLNADGEDVGEYRSIWYYF
ncbi:KamA family radical SAM protein [Methanocella sp. MCL-LM]|uniref:KamA family radical SAM protein n=1 Tax=Methanocella sp. MCL-LM TaxID=3412035 RepID=UPI003C78A2C5